MGRWRVGFLTHSPHPSWPKQLPASNPLSLIHYRPTYVRNFRLVYPRIGSVWVWQKRREGQNRQSNGWLGFRSFLGSPVHPYMFNALCQTTQFQEKARKEHGGPDLFFVFLNYKNAISRGNGSSPIFGYSLTRHLSDFCGFSYPSASLGLTSYVAVVDSTNLQEWLFRKLQDMQPNGGGGVCMCAHAHAHTQVQVSVADGITTTERRWKSNLLHNQSFSFAKQTCFISAIPSSLIVSHSSFQLGYTIRLFSICQLVHNQLAS